MQLRTAASALVLLLALPLGCKGASTAYGEPAEAVARNAEEIAIARVLTDWHRAASEADGPRYFGHMTEHAVFLGTDASERWTKDQFRAFCEPYFSQGHGWTYECRERHIFVARDTAWFDERLWNDKYGECRGTGTLQKTAGEWKLAHYSLTLPVPNELAADVVKLIRGR